MAYFMQNTDFLNQLVSLLQPNAIKTMIKIEKIFRRLFYGILSAIKGTSAKL